MNLHTLDQQSMSALQTLADTNVKIGEAKGILADLKAQETTYFQEREQATIVKIQSVLEDSETILAKINGNYAEVTQFYTEVSSFVGFLKEIQQNVSDSIANFNVHVTEWERQTDEERKALDLLARQLDVQQHGIETDKKVIAEGKKKMKEDLRLIGSRQAQIKEALQVLENKKNHG